MVLALLFSAGWVDVLRRCLPLLRSVFCKLVDSDTFASFLPLLLVSTIARAASVCPGVCMQVVFKRRFVPVM